MLRIRHRLKSLMRARLLVVIVVIWIALGGLVIEVQEELEGGNHNRTSNPEHDVWLQATVPTHTLHWFQLKIEYVGEPFYLKFSSITDSSLPQHVIIDHVILNGGGNDSIQLLKSGPIVIPYQSDTYLAPKRLAFHTLCRVPVQFDNGEGCTITIKGRVINNEDKVSSDVDLQFVLKRRRRSVRVIPFWVSLWEHGMSG